MTDQIQDQDVELDENEIEEAHDPKNAEAQSIASVQSAEDKGPKAKARKGDKSNSEKMPKTKAGMINAAYTKMAGMKKEDLPDGFIKKITENLIDKARTELVKLFGRKFKRIESITSFINRFEKPGEEYPDLDFDFIKYKLNNK